MSYILDALKRSEQERRRAESPTAPELLPPPPPPRRHWLGIAVALVLVANGAALLWHSWPTPDTAPPQAAAAVDTGPAPAPLESQASLAAVSGSEQQDQVGTLAMPAERAPVERAPAPAAPPPRPGSGRVVVAEAPLTPEPMAIETPSAQPVAPAASDAPLLSALPADFQRQLPPLSVNIHVYAEQPAGRFILVNMQRYKEGSQLPGGIQLERITPKGMVLSYQGRRFQMIVR